MLSRASVNNEARPFALGTLPGVLVPQRTQHRIIFGIVAVCLTSVMMGAALFSHVQSDRVLLVDSTGEQVSPASTTNAGTPTTINASKALMRIDQSDSSQYASQEQHDQWWESTCSAASMAEIFNAYGGHYRIADVLQKEISVGAITASSGLLYPTGIDQTAATFGFAIQTLNNPTLDQVLAVANAGKPVIVNFPPQTWTGGHFLVVLGSVSINGTVYVHLADSSTLNMQYMKVGTFLYYWKGFAKVLTPKASAITVASTDQYAVVGKPTLTAAFINQVLAAYKSPAAGTGQDLYNLGVTYSIDPAFALAFFLHESSMGTEGMATITKSLGNLRCIDGASCVNNAGGTCGTNDSCYASFPTWQAGYLAWYKLIHNLYVAEWGLTTVATIIPRYAPPSDGNNDNGYIASVEHEIDAWHSGQVIVA